MRELKLLTNNELCVYAQGVTEMLSDGSPSHTTIRSIIDELASRVINSDDALRRKVKRAFEKGGIVNATKAVRAQTGVSIKDAKSLAEGWAGEYKWEIKTNQSQES